jgi:hypothetical protein
MPITVLNEGRDLLLQILLKIKLNDWDFLNYYFVFFGLKLKNQKGFPVLQIYACGPGNMFLTFLIIYVSRIRKPNNILEHNTWHKSDFSTSVMKKRIANMFRRRIIP